MEGLPPRSYCVQYRETDYAFISRLLAEEGLGFCFVEQAAGGDHDNGNSFDNTLGDAPCHSLLLFATNEPLPEDAVSAHALGGTGVRFHQAGSQEAQDAVTAFGARRILQAAVSTALSWSFEGKHCVTASLPTAQDFGSKNAPQLESYDTPGAAFARSAFSDSAAAERTLRLSREALEARNKQFFGSGSVRSFRPGHRFVLANSPLDKEAQLRGESLDASAANASRHFFLLGVQHAGVNNLPKGVSETATAMGDMVTALLMPSAQRNESEHTQDQGGQDVLGPLLEEARARGYANHFSAQRVMVPWRPVLEDDNGILLNPRPTVSGVQTAIVVGAQGEGAQAGAAGEIHTDALHRVRVQFHWQRGRQSAANDDTTPHTAWLRMASRYAGKGLGAQFVPRIRPERLSSPSWTAISIILSCWAKRLQRPGRRRCRANTGRRSGWRGPCAKSFCTGRRSAPCRTRQSRARQ